MSEPTGQSMEEARKLASELFGVPKEYIEDDITSLLALALDTARAEALEEAALVVEDEFPPDASEECADRIRALKDKR